MDVQYHGDRKGDKFDMKNWKVNKSGRKKKSEKNKQISTRANARNLSLPRSLLMMSCQLTVTLNTSTAESAPVPPAP